MEGFRNGLVKGVLVIPGKNNHTSHVKGLLWGLGNLTKPVTLIVHTSLLLNDILLRQLLEVRNAWIEVHSQLILGAIYYLIHMFNHCI